MFYETIDVINIFKAVKGQRPVKKIPKLSPGSLLQLQNLTNAFNTKWSNISPSLYFEHGMCLWKTFSYAKFMHESVLKKYIKNDKIVKRMKVDKSVIVKSFKFLKSKGYKSLESYTRLDNDTLHLCVYDYFHNKIDKVLIAYLMFELFKPRRLDKRYTSYIWDNYHEMKSQVKRYSRYIKKLEKEML